MRFFTLVFRAFQVQLLHQLNSAADSLWVFQPFQSSSANLQPPVVHPGLARPTAILCDVAVAPLLEYLRIPLTIDETLRAWSHRTHGNDTVEILGWFWDNGVIVEVS